MFGDSFVTTRELVVGLVDSALRMGVEDLRRLKVVADVIVGNEDRGAILGTILGFLPDLGTDELLHIVQRSAEQRAASPDAESQAGHAG